MSILPEISDSELDLPVFQVVIHWKVTCKILVMVKMKSFISFSLIEEKENKLLLRVGKVLRDHCI